MVKRGDLIAKTEGDKELIEVDKATYSLTPTLKQEVMDDSEKNSLAGSDFIEKTIGTILSLHEKVLDAKDETLEALKGENRFLKEALFSMQELYDEDRKTVETLTTQLKHTQEELEFTRRKYKLMWNKAIENYKK